MDTQEHRLTSGGVLIPLEPKALLLLGYLVSHPGKLIRKHELLDALWPDASVTESALTRSITLLRRALKDSSREPLFIETVPKIGYRFIAEVNSTGPNIPALNAEPYPELRRTRQSDEGDQDRWSTTDLSLNASLAVSSRWPIRQRVAAGIAVSLVIVAGLLAFSHRILAIPGNSFGSDHAGPSTLMGSAAVANQDAAREEIRRGLFFYDKRNGPASEAAFRHAIELDPQSSSAHAGLAQALITRSLLAPAASPEIVASAEEEGRKAVALDPANSEAYIALGMVQVTFTWEWQEARKNLERGLQLNPKSANGNTWYAIYLISAGRPEEAIQRMKVAVDTAPLSFYTLRMQASILYYGRRYDEALQILDRAREMSPSQTALLDIWVLWIDEQRGLYDDAVEYDLNLQRSLPPQRVDRLRAAYHAGGWTAYWKLRLVQMRPETRAGCALYDVGRAYLRAGEPDHAIYYLEKAAEQHCFWLATVLVDPGLDNLRRDSRFPQLVALVDPRYELQHDQQALSAYSLTH